MSSSKPARTERGQAPATTTASTHPLAGAPTDPDGPTGQLASWLAALHLDTVPASVRERAKLILLDGIGCALVGAQLPWSRVAVEGVTAMEGAGDAIIIGWGRTTSAPAAALLNGTFIQGFELDDYHPLAPLHSASLVVPSLLATAQELKRVDGAELLLGAIAGFEVGPRVGLALHGAEMLTRGWHSGPVFGTHASAAASGVLRNLTAAQHEDALGLAGTQSAGLMAAQFEAMSKRMHHGFAARNGFYAAGLAAVGYTGIKRVYEREYGGFLATFGEGHAPDAAQITDALGERWETERIALKPYATMGGIHAPIDAVLALAAQQRLDPDDIARIEVDVSEPAYHHGGWTAKRPLEVIGAQMSIAYGVAVAMLDGAALVDQFTPSRIDRDDVWKLIERTTVRHDAAFDALGTFRTRLRVTHRDGSEREVLVEGPRGGPTNPLNAQEIVDKFRALTDRVLEPTRRDEIQRLVLGLETLATVDDLIEVLAAPVHAPFE
jgi:aconitate decarboxylase